MLALAGCGPGETPGGVGIRDGVPYFAFRLCPGEVVTRLDVITADDDEQVWSAQLIAGRSGSAVLAWSGSPDYDTTGTLGREFTDEQQDLNADVAGVNGRSLGRWRFRLADLRSGELLEGYNDNRYLPEEELAAQDPTGCSG